MTPTSAPSSDNPTLHNQGHPATEEAAQTRLDKSAKLDLAMEAVFTEDLRELARADRSRVSRFLNQRLFNRPRQAAQPTPPEGEAMAEDNDMGHIIIGDDITINLPPTNQPPAPAPTANGSTPIPATPVPAPPPTVSPKVYEKVTWQPQPDGSAVEIANEVSTDMGVTWKPAPIRNRIRPKPQ